MLIVPKEERAFGAEELSVLKTFIFSSNFSILKDVLFSPFLNRIFQIIFDTFQILRTDQIAIGALERHSNGILSRFESHSNGIRLQSE